MTKNKGQVYCLQVTDIKHAYNMRPPDKYIHLITFQEEDGSVYQAEECETNPVSRFIKNLKNNFIVSNPGKGGFPDWVRFQSADNGAVKIAPLNRDDIMISQVALNNAVQLGIKRNWSEEDILKKAYFFAGNIKKMAYQLSQEEII